MTTQSRQRPRSLPAPVHVKHGDLAELAGMFRTIVKQQHQLISHPGYRVDVFVATLPVIHLSGRQWAKLNRVATFNAETEDALLVGINQQQSIVYDVHLVTAIIQPFGKNTDIRNLVPAFAESHYPAQGCPGPWQITALKDVKTAGSRDQTEKQSVTDEFQFIFQKSASKERRTYFFFRIKASTLQTRFSS